MADKLTPQQEMAVRDRGGTLLVAAAAGSGKTKVLVDRIMGYLRDPVDPANLDDFLIITYTKAAAAELRGKIAAKLSEIIAEDPGNKHLQQQVQRLYLAKISTVHSFCADLLRENAYRMDFSGDFRVGDENECRELRQAAMDRVLELAFSHIHEDEDLRAFVDTQGLGRTDALIPDIVLKVYDSARCHLNPEQWLENCLRNADVSYLNDPAQTVWGKALMEDLFFCLDLQIDAYQGCIRAMACFPELGKPVDLFCKVLNQLVYLRESESWNQVVDRKEIEYGRLVFPKNNPDMMLAEQVKAIRKDCRILLEKKLRSFADPAARVLEDLNGTFQASRGMISLVRRFSAEYDQLKKQRRILDFGDLEHRTLDMLLGKQRSGSTAAARETGSQFREILVDEYQDSNEVQDAIFGALTEKRGNLFLVGDVKQSIYQFRLADPGIFLEKYSKYALAENAVAGQGRKIMLSRNFRSGGAVLAAVNDVFRACMSEKVGGLEYGDQEALYEGIPHDPIGEPEVELHMVSVREETYPEEAAFVAKQIHDLLDGRHMVRQGNGLRPIMPEDIVILLRSPGSVGSYFQNALDGYGIRCSSGGGSDLLRTPEIQVLRSVLQTVSNPRQDIPLIAALTSPVFQFTADDLAKIRGMNKKRPFYDVLLSDQREKCREFVALLNDLRETARMESLVKLMDEIFIRTRMDSLYAAMDGGETKLANLQYFFRLAVDFESGGRRSLAQFLEHLDALEEKGIPGGTEQSGGAVTIMSIHKSKGLEFPVVFLCGLSREFNRESLRAQVLCDQELGLGLSCVDAGNRIRYPSIAKRAIAAKAMADSLSEEMRVLYVAMTRARDRLIMTYSSKNPEGEISSLALRKDLCGRELITGNVVCPGEWVLYEAVSRTEAGAFHGLGARPAQTHLGQYPWRITVSEAPEAVCASSKVAEVGRLLPDGTAERLLAFRNFKYRYSDAVYAPSKLTATALKGREKDQEALEYTDQTAVRPLSWRKAGSGSSRNRGTEYGTAMHKTLQYLRYDRCLRRDDITAELDRLTEQGLLTLEEARLIDVEQIVRFFSSEIGVRLRSSKTVLREFKFSVLEDAAVLGCGPTGEQVLLQGVVDCAAVEDDGIMIVDFKTDHVTEETLKSLADRYRGQVEAYSRAMAQVFEKPVKDAYLYFFRLDRFVKM